MTVPDIEIETVTVYPERYYDSDSLKVSADKHTVTFRISEESNLRYAFVMINGCGATTMMEMLVLFKDTVEFLKAKGIEVVASMVGEILTVQEAAGFQMIIAKLDEEMLRLWNTPCRTPAFSKE